MVTREPRVRLAYREQQVLVVQWDKQVDQASLAEPDSQDSKEQLVILEVLEIQVQRVFWEPLGRKVTQDSVVQLESRDQQGHWDLKELLDLKASPGFREQEVLKDQRDQLDH